ncbi:helix-turn-helix transcriptional regulator [Lentzea sp. HUAS12]|uniref:helix-turn-helix domain-containing protein n=1 Tax=Lentzea sp. HUAS12 TaxID=2951806 RepID=UPI0020A03D95|nr:helix-turn-helix transcriptional regulator [Lentzea sp. HUAS12]USX55613.1 helix-turn-helix domain-containing protein [Lentzea sp. HUAS12]
MPKRDSTVRGREFGDGLRAVVEATGLPAREVADKVGWHESKLSNVINGRGGATLLEVALLLGMCQASPAEQTHLLSLYPVADEKGWWQQHGKFSPVLSRTVTENLRAAEALVGWQTHMVPVLLQTVDYMSAVLSASRTIPADELQQRVQAQLAMQEAVRQNQVKCTFYIHESALHLEVGGAEVHGGQVFHLFLMSAWSNIDVRIVPSSAGAHAGLAGPFTSLAFEKYVPLVWVETDNSSLFVENKDAIAGYESIVSALDEVSLNATETRALLARLHEEVEAASTAQPNDSLDRVN